MFVEETEVIPYHYRLPMHCIIPSTRFWYEPDAKHPNLGKFTAVD